MTGIMKFHDSFSRYIKNAHFAACNATIEYYENLKLDKTDILRFATCQYDILDKRHLILKGASGNGKPILHIPLDMQPARKHVIFQKTGKS